MFDTALPQLEQAAQQHDAWELLRDVAGEMFDLAQPVPLAIGVREELIELGLAAAGVRLADDLAVLRREGR